MGTVREITQLQIPVNWTSAMSAAHQQSVVLQKRHNLPYVPNFDLLSYNSIGDKAVGIFDSKNGCIRNYYVVKVIKIEENNWRAIEVVCLSDGEDAIDAMDVAHTFLSN